jgi:hypothetical protein
MICNKSIDGIPVYLHMSTSVEAFKEQEHVYPQHLCSAQLKAAKYAEYKQAMAL